ncbi:MAG: hypothetical protein V1743_08460 [Nanoarchaeota archaeon]
MNKLFMVMAAFLVLSFGSAMACHEQVHVQDEIGNDMSGVTVELSSDCGWGPATDDTDGSGWTTNWATQSDCTYTGSVPTPPIGYSCDSQSDYNTGGQGHIYLTCTPNEVPEFGAIGAVAAVVIAGLSIVVMRKRK